MKNLQNGGYRDRTGACKGQNLMCFHFTNPLNFN